MVRLTLKFSPFFHCCVGTWSGWQSIQIIGGKVSLRPAEPSTYLSDVEMQAVCAHYAALYNEHEPPLKVCYARSWLLKLRDRERGTLVCSVEEFLPGAYVKYSNNSGYVGRETSTTEERERNTPQAFSHFSFVASDFRLMIVDIQGVADSYTDPQIHSADGRGSAWGISALSGWRSFSKATGATRSVGGSDFAVSMNSTNRVGRPHRGTRCRSEGRSRSRRTGSRRSGTPSQRQSQSVKPLGTQLLQIGPSGRTRDSKAGTKMTTMKTRRTKRTPANTRTRPRTLQTRRRPCRGCIQGTPSRSGKAVLHSRSIFTRSW